MKLSGTVLLLAMMLPSSGFADGADIVNERCLACHTLERPDFKQSGIEERLLRAAPPLYYAGNKYRQQWLQEWLQSPTRLYPAGYRIAGAVRSSDEGDIVDTEALVSHITLNETDAIQVSNYLMTLRPYDELIEKDNYIAGTVAKRMGMLDFRKFKGCNACHQDEQDAGGISGPELYSAWQRLQPEYLSSYIQNPVAWDAHTIMPVLDMNEAAVHKLVHYLKLIGEE
ncbi:MAG: cytochrome C [Gammaproteobacteria bacterium]